MRAEGRWLAAGGATGGGRWLAAGGATGGGWRCDLTQTEVRSAVAGGATCERQRCGRRWLAELGRGDWRWLAVGRLAETAECERVRDRDGEVRICSSFDATQLFFNHSCKEFRELRNSYNSKLTPLRCIQSGTRLSAANLDLTQGNDLVGVSASDLLAKYPEVTGLDDFEEGLGVDGAVVPLKRCLFKEFDRCGSSKKLKDMVVKQEK
nr:replication protein A 70 kDa DNA-binding subunit B-like [Ipomoea batatas]